MNEVKLGIICNFLLLAVAILLGIFAITIENTHRQSFQPYSYWAIVVAFCIFIVFVAFSLRPSMRGEIISDIFVLFMTLLFMPIFIFLFSIAYRYTGLTYLNETYELMPLDYIYFSVVTFTTLGYGDFTPSPDSRILSIFQALLGFLFVPVLLGQFLAVLRDIERQADK